MKTRKIVIGRPHVMSVAVLLVMGALACATQQQQVKDPASPQELDSAVKAAQPQVVQHAQQQLSASLNAQPLSLPQNVSPGQQPNARDRPGSHESPIVVEMLESSRTADERKADRDYQRKNDIRIQRLTLGMFIVAAVQALLFLWQLRQMTESIKHARRSATATYRNARAAEISAKDARNMSLIAQRPCIIGTPKGFLLEGSPGRPVYHLHVEFWNSGPNPAIDVATDLQIATVPFGTRPDFNFRGVPRSVLGPRTLKPMTTRTRPVALDVPERQRTKEVEVYLWFRVEYRDPHNPSVVYHHEFRARAEFLGPDQLPDSEERVGFAMTSEQSFA